MDANPGEFCFELVFDMKKVVYFLFLLTFNFPLNAQITGGHSSINGNDTTIKLIYKNVDVKAVFVGGESKFLDYFQNKFQMPSSCNDCLDSIDSLMHFRFVVSVVGKISNIEFMSGQEDLKKKYPEIIIESIRVLENSPRWIPGQLRGKFVNSFREVPINLNSLKLKRKIKIQEQEQDTLIVAMPQYSLPKFKGGEKAFTNYILDRLVFPIRCKLAKINGNVMARFIVNPDGTVSNVEIIEHNYLCPEFSKEAIRVITQSPKWTPAMLDGKPVKCFQTVPIKFVVEEN